MLSKHIMLQIKELMERYHGDVYVIAEKMKMDPVTVQLWIDTITDLFQ